MNPNEEFRARIATFADFEARTLIHFLVEELAGERAQRSGKSYADARDEATAIALDYLAGIQGKLPAEAK